MEASQEKHAPTIHEQSEQVCEAAFSQGYDVLRVKPAKPKPTILGRMTRRDGVIYLATAEGMDTHAAPCSSLAEATSMFDDESFWVPAVWAGELEWSDRRPVILVSAWSQDDLTIYLQSVFETTRLPECIKLSENYGVSMMLPCSIVLLLWQADITRRYSTDTYRIIFDVDYSAPVLLGGATVTGGIAGATVATGAGVGIAGTNLALVAGAALGGLAGLAVGGAALGVWFILASRPSSEAKGEHETQPAKKSE